MCVNAIVVLLLSWFVLFWLFAGLGLLVRMVAGRRVVSSSDLFISFWCGWGSALAVLQIWHLFLAVRSIVWVGLAVGSLVGLLAHRLEFMQWFRAIWSPEKRRATIAKSVVFLLVAALVADFAIGTIAYDTGLYHVNTVGWETAYPIVPGLANLHARLGFNSSSLLYFAMLESGPWNGISQHVGIGLLAVSLLGAGMLALHRFWAKGQLADAFLAVALVPALIAAGEDSSGMSTDYPAFALAIVLGYLLLRVWESRPEQRREAHHFLVVMVFLAAVAVSVKLSVGVYAGLVIVLAYRRFRNTGPLPIRRKWPAVRVFVIAFVVLGPWLTRGFMLSGYPAFPVALGGLGLDWQVPRALAMAEQETTVQWARWVGSIPDQPGSGLAWLGPWIRYTVPRMHAFMIPLGLAMVGLTWLFQARRHAEKKSRSEMIAVFALTLPILFWFLTVPTLRFVQGPIWSLGGISLVLGAGALRDPGWERNRRRYLLWIINVLVLGSLAVTIGYINPPEANSVFPAFPVADLVPVQTKSGLTIYTLPDLDREDRIFGDELLSTPSFNPNLRLRRDGELSSGFTVQAPSP